MKKSEKIYEDLRFRLADNLSRLRVSHRLTQLQLGKASGLHWRHVQKIEAGNVNVTLVTIARLANGLEVDPLELVSAAA